MAKQADFLAAIFSSPEKANASLAELKTMEKNGAIKIVDAAVITKQADGKLKIDEIDEFTTKKGLGRGAVIGAIFGAIFPPTMIVSALVGAATGGTLGHFRDSGMENAELKALGEELMPGSSAIVAIVENTWADKFVSAISGYDKLSRIALDADTTVAVISASEDGDETKS